MTTPPADLRQQPGVCPECKGRVWGSADMGGDYDRLCFCTGQQPARPESGEAVRLCCDELIDAGRAMAHYEDPRLRPLSPKNFVLYDAARKRAASVSFRLQSALTAAQRENASLRNLAANLQPGPISEALSGQRYTTETELRDQLTAAQQRTAALHAALRTYGWHKPECDYMQEELPCTCGFMDAVKEQGNG